MNFKRMRELIIQINKLTRELDAQKNEALKYCKQHGVSKLTKKNGIIINYYPSTEYKAIDTDKVKQLGIYDNVLKTTSKKEYVKISLKEVK